MSRFIPGDHLVTARLGYTHHGLYVGSDLVIHYQGPNFGLPGEIVITSLDEFSDGKPVWCKFCPVRRYDRTESLERARTRLGEHRYDVLFSNCEHFVMWCIHGLHHSPQISQVATAVAKAALRTQQTTIMPPATTVLTRERTASDCMTLAITLTTLATSPSWVPLATGALAVHAVSRLWSWLTGIMTALPSHNKEHSMTIPFFRDGFALPVAQALLVLLNQEVAKTELNIERLTQLTFNFRNPGYSAEQGGVHPVELRLIRGLDGWLFDYITDFSYQGLGQDAELCKELDFNFLDGEHTMLGWGPLRLAEARELFDIWQSNFIAYCRLECFSVAVTGD